MSTEKPSFEERLDQLIADDTEGLLDIPEKPHPITATDRLERAFLEIVDFRREEDRQPSAETLEISERKLGARLVGFLNNEAKADAVRHLDEFNLLALPQAPTSVEELLETDLDDFNLLDDETDIYDFTGMEELQTGVEEYEVAQRKKAKDFEKYKPLFELKHRQLESGEYKLTDYSGLNHIRAGSFFVLNGVMLYVEQVGESEHIKNGREIRKKERLRVIFENGTESSMYRQSLGSQLGEKDGLMLAATEHTNFTEEVNDETVPDGYIYVLKSLSSNPEITGLKNLYKIGYSRGPVAQRIANAEKDPTYLMAPVESIAEYAVQDIKISKLEHLLHRVFAEAQLDITMRDEQGQPFKPSEWFIVPLTVIDQALAMISSGDIVDFEYSPVQQKLVYRKKKE